MCLLGFEASTNVKAATSCAPSSQLSAISSQLGDQRRQHPFNFNYFSRKALVLFSLEKVEISREQAVIFHLARRSHRNLQESPKLSIAFAAASLRDVRSNRCGGTPYLTGQSVDFFFWKSSTSRIDVEREVVCFLPYLQISEILHEIPVLLSDS